MILASIVALHMIVIGVAIYISVRGMRPCRKTLVTNKANLRDNVRALGKIANSGHFSIRTTNTVMATDKILED